MIGMNEFMEGETDTIYLLEQYQTIPKIMKHLLQHPHLLNTMNSP